MTTRRWGRGSLLGLALSIILFAAASRGLADEEPSQPDTGVGWRAASLDAVLVRPISFIQTAAGSVLFVATVPLVVPSGRDGFSIAYETFVEAPASETFNRPLGRF